MARKTAVAAATPPPNEDLLRVTDRMTVGELARFVERLREMLRRR